MNERKDHLVCSCKINPQCPCHGDVANREANEMSEFFAEIAVAENSAGRYVIVDQANVAEIMGRLAEKNEMLIGQYRLVKVDKAVRVIQ